MKQTVKTSRAAGQLEKMFRELNKHYFNGGLTRADNIIEENAVRLWPYHLFQGVESRGRKQVTR